VTDDAYTDELNFSLDIARQAGAVLMDHYERLEQIDHKSARDVVTEADHLSEALILDAIRAHYPADAILAEETGEHRAKAGEAPTSGRGRVWIVDPLDGTVNYAAGLPWFSVTLAYQEEGVTRVGVTHAPAVNIVARYAEGSIASVNGRAAQVSGRDTLADAVVSIFIGPEAQDTEPS
jgi:myo-inositol-1(or 4)-monophosphatase